MEEYAVKHCDSINKSECSSGVASLTEYSSDTTVANRENLERHSPLSIFREFSNYFEEKLHEIDQIHVPNTTELKFPIYVEWVKQLREQNDDLIKTITELEHTACNRLELLQEKYKNDKNKIDKQKNDIMNLLEVIRRAREEHKWNVDGLEFNEIGYNEIFGNRKNTMGLQEESSNVNDGIVLLNLEMKTNKRLINDLADKDCEIKRLEREIHQLNIELEHREQQMKSYYFGSDNDSLNASDLKTTRYAIRINNDEQQIMDVNLPKDFTELQQQNSKLSREIEQLKLLLTEKQKDTINKIEKVTSMAPEPINIIQNVMPDVQQTSEVTILKNNISCDDGSYGTQISKLETESVQQLQIEIKELLKQIQDIREQLDNEREIRIELDQKLQIKDNQLSTMQKHSNNYITKLQLLQLEFLKISKTTSNCTLLSPPVPPTTSASTTSTTTDNSWNSFASVITSMESEIQKNIVNNESLECVRNELQLELETAECINNAIIEFTSKIDSLTRENQQLAKMVKDMMAIGKQPSSTTSPPPPPSITSTSTCVDDGNKLLRIGHLLEKTLKKSLDHDQLKSLINGNLNIIIDLIKDLQYEISTKDNMLTAKENEIRDCMCMLERKDRNVCEINKKLQHLEKQDACNNETINSQKDALKIQSLTINELEILSNSLREKNMELHEMLASNSILVSNIQLEKSNLETQLNNQYTTITNLRTALEDCKRSGSGSGVSGVTPSVINGNDRDNGGDIDILSEQLSNCFYENLQQNNQMLLLRDENLYLREQIFNLLMDSEVNTTKFKSKLLVEGDLLIHDQYYNNIIDSLTEEVVMLRKQQYKPKSILKQYSSSTTTSVSTASDQKLVNRCHFVDQEHYHQRHHHHQQNQYEIYQDEIELCEAKVAAQKSELLTVEDENRQLYQRIAQLEKELYINIQETLSLSKENDFLNMKLKMQSTSTTNCECGRRDDITVDEHDAFIKRIKLLETELEEHLENLKSRDEEIQSIKCDHRKILCENDKQLHMIEELKRTKQCSEKKLEISEKELLMARNKLSEITQRENHIRNDLLKKTQELCETHARELKFKEDLNNLRLELRNNLRDAEQQSTFHKNTTNELQDSLSNTINQYELLLNDKTKLQNDNVSLKAEVERYVALIRKLTENTKLLEDREVKLKNHLSNASNQLNDVKKRLQHCSVVNHDLSTRKQQLECELTDSLKKYHDICGKFSLLEDKHRQLEIDYQSVLTKNNHLLNIREHAIVALETAKKVDEEQQDREKVIQDQCIHIRTLLKEREILRCKVDNLHKDNVILYSKAVKYEDSLSDGCYSLPPVCIPVNYATSRVYHYNSDPVVVNNNPEFIVKKLKRTTKHITRTRRFWERSMNQTIESD